MKKDFASDERGAIMVIGLCAALLLVGCLWLLMGIGSTIVWREKMQEAVDAAAFSSAVIHAWGMNYIVAVNLVILALVTIHVVIGIVADGLTFVATASLIPPLTEAAPKIYEAALYVRKAQIAYDAYMMPAALTLGAGQTAVAVITPQIGTGVAAEVGSEYDATVLAFGTSNFPSGRLMDIKGLTRPSNWDGQLYGSIRLGLPVAYEPLKDMCKRPAFWVADWMSTAFRKMAFIDKTLESLEKAGVPKMLTDLVKNSINETFRTLAVRFGNGLEDLECSDGVTYNYPWMRWLTYLPATVFPLGSDPNPFWAAPGGKKMWGVAKNDSQWMQIWAWTQDASKVDDDERKVAIARRAYGDVGTAKVEGTYVAQAEFYYDCGSSDDGWDDVGCNGYSAESQFAMYNMKWRARLRRYRQADVGALLLDTSIAGLDGFGVIKKGLEKLPGGGAQKVAEASEIYRKFLDGWLDKLRGGFVNKPDGEIIH